MAKTWRQRVIDILGLSLKMSPNDLPTFISEIPELDIVPNSFVYKRCDEQGIYQDVCSQTAIERTADICVQLQLMEKDTGRLTALGEKATSPGSFDQVIENQLWQTSLKQFTFSRSKLTTIVKTILRGQSIELPTAEKIWSELGEPGDLMTFKRLLRLLAQCGGIQVSQKPVYLPAPHRR